MNSTSFQRSTCVVVVVLVTIATVVNGAPSPTLDGASSELSEVTTISHSQTTALTGMETAEQQRGRGSKMTRRMILPLLVGILLKVSSLLPIFLGKLTLMAIGSIMTSKLALAIAGILILHKFQSEHSWSSAGLTSFGTEAEESYASYPHRRRG